MKPITVVAPYNPAPFFGKTLARLTRSPFVERVVIINHEQVDFEMARCSVLVGGPLTSHQTLQSILEATSTKYLLVLFGTRQISAGPGAVGSMLAKAESTRAGLLYSDFYDQTRRGKTSHPLSDYQPGSVCDDFDFGAVMLFSLSAIRNALEKYNLLPGIQLASLYDLRLKVSIDHPVSHLPEPLYSVISTKERSSSERLFAYVDPRNEAAQKEMEAVFTHYLKKIGAYLSPHQFREVEHRATPFPVVASVVIPVRNRRETIAQAVKSAQAQETDFSFNVIVVDNLSTDGTTQVLSDLTRQYPTLRHIIPSRTDLGIGGCWNEALYSNACGRYAVQLDSDDLYATPHTLQKMVDMLREGNYAMVIGSYTLVNEKLEQIPPGLVDHREWTDETGRNNALRINGLGAPRAFDTGLMRTIPFLNVSYGEDYAAALRISREYRIGRIYESLYLCRRWPGNTDAALSIEDINRNNIFKDEVRGEEIVARQKMNANG